MLLHGFGYINLVEEQGQSDERKETLELPWNIIKYSASWFWGSKCFQLTAILDPNVANSWILQEPNNHSKRKRLGV